MALFTTYWSIFSPSHLQFNNLGKLERQRLSHQAPLLHSNGMKKYIQGEFVVRKKYRRLTDMFQISIKNLDPKPSKICVPLMPSYDQETISIFQRSALQFLQLTH